MRNAVSQDWFVVRTQPKSELRAALNIERQGFATYLPRYLKITQRVQRRISVAVPLFPSYLFVSIDLSTQRWRAIKSSFGVAQLVGTAEQPTPLSPDIVASIKQREDENGYVRLPRAIGVMRPGATVCVQDGPFENYGGIFEAACDSERVLVLLDFMGRKVRVALSEHAVAAL